MASRGEITEPKEGGRRSGSRRWQQRGWKQHRAPCRDPCHATVTLKRRIQRHVLVDTAADRYDARHLQVIISLILFPFVSPSPRFPCRVAVCVCVQWRERKGRERCDGRVEEEEEGEAVFPKNRWDVFSKYDICCGAMKGLIISGSDLVESRVWRI